MKNETLKYLKHLVEHFARSDREPGYWAHAAEHAYRAEAAARRELAALNWAASQISVPKQDMRGLLNLVVTINEREAATPQERAAALNGMIEILIEIRDMCLDTH